jgi:carboxylesterase
MDPRAAPVLSLRGSKRLLICFHGFPATPSDFRRMADVSASRGYDMVAPLLPGCGTRPEDLLPMNFKDFIEAARSVWREHAKNYEKAFLVGTSVGGALALATAQEFCGEPAAVATMGSPIVLNAVIRHGMLKSPFLYLAPIIGPFIKSIGAKLPDQKRVGQDGDEAWLGYRGTYPAFSWTLQTGLRSIERKLGQITCPILICHARGDRVISDRNAMIIARAVGSSRIELDIANMDGFTHTRHNLILYDSQRERVWKRILDFFDSTA